MSDYPLVSVILPVYNREKYLATAIESVLQQTYGNLELLIVDDGSRDRSPEIIKEYAAKDKRVRFVLHKENRGVSAARNTALSMARGEWIALIDSDDAWHPERLEKLLKVVDGEEGVFVADDLLLCFDRDGELVPWESSLSRRKMISFSESGLLKMDLLEYLKKLPDIKPLFPMQVASHFDLRFTEGCLAGEDFEFFCHLFRVGLNLKILPEPLYFYRLTPGALTAKANALKNFDHLVGVYERLLAHPGFSLKEKQLLASLKERLQRDRAYLLFTWNLERKAYKEAFQIACHSPYVVARLLWSLPRSLRYRLSAKIRGGVVKS